METKPRVVLIDLSSLWWTAWMVNAENGIREPRAITLANVQRCIQPGDLVAIACDSGPSFRKALDPNYKAQREKQPPAAYAELEKCKDRLRADGYLLWSADGFEADDILATATDKAVRAGHEVRICSADKDLMSLLGPSVDCLRTHLWTVVGVKEFTEKYKIKPSLFTEWLALKGDSSDNVKGCPGVGDVKASELIGKFGTVAKLYRALDAGEQVHKMPTVVTALKENRAAVELSRKLVELNFDAPIDFEAIYAERKVTPLTTQSELPSDGEPGDENSALPSASNAPPVQEPGSPAAAPPDSASAPTALTVQSAAVVVEYERQLEPRSLRAAVWLGQHLFDSRLYQKFTTPEAITAVIIRGRELGLGATTSLDVFHVIEGKPSPYAYLMIARAKAHPDCEYFYCKEGASAESATWVTKNRRNPVETSVTYTFEQAKAAGLVKPNSAWFKHPEDQVVKTAGAKLARREYPDAALGLYAVVEMGGNED